MKREGISTPFHPQFILRALSCSRSPFKIAFCVFDKNILKKAFRFDFVMIHVGTYTKCSEMFRFEKSLNFNKSVRCEKYLIEQATKSLITYSEWSFSRYFTFL